MIALHWPIMSGQSDCIMWKYSQNPNLSICWADPTFGSFYLIKTGFTLGERVSLVKVSLIIWK